MTQHLTKNKKRNKLPNESPTATKREITKIPTELLDFKVSSGSSTARINYFNVKGETQAN